MNQLSEWTSQKWIKRRIIMVSVLFLISLGFILNRSYDLHIVENQKVNRLANRQYQVWVKENPKRGSIFDRKGRILAQDVEVASVAIHPHLIEDQKEVQSFLSKTLELKSSSLHQKIKSNKKFIWIKRRVPYELGQIIKNKKLSGVVVQSEYKTFYPNQEIGGQILGAVGYDAKALGGIELSLDDYIKSDFVKLALNKDAKGRSYTTNFNEGIYHDIHLSLDIDIQYKVEEFLKEGAKKSQADSGFAIVLDPHTGELIAMANYPDFNPNLYWKYDLDRWQNQAISLNFEPGSTFKTILAAAALKSGKVKKDDVFYCEKGRYKVGKHIIKDHDPYENLSVADIIKYSSNIGVTKIVEKIGNEPFYNFINEIGFNNKVGIKLPGERSGSLRDVRSWRDINASNIAFGQGIAVNGLQMVQAYGVIASYGWLNKPHLVKKIISSSNEEIFHERDISAKKVLDETTAKDLIKMLELVVTEEGTGTLAALDTFPVAGKTGTAQKFDPHHGGYHPDNYISSFLGIVPSNNPKYVVYVVYDSPKGKRHTGGVVAAPVFKKISSYLIANSGINPPSQHYASK